MGRDDSLLRERLVFLVGARRSGTNWLQRIICAHPDAVAVPSETHLFSHGLAPLAERFQHGSAGSPKTAKVFMARDEMLDLLRDVADRVLGGVAEALQPGARLIVERTPWHAYHLGLISAVYPDARVVHIVRDGRDVTRSLLSQPWGPTTMASAAQEWRSAVEAAREGSALGARYLEVRYEDLLRDPQGGVGMVFERLGLELQPDVVSRVETEAAVKFNADARSPATAAGKWRSELTARDLMTFDEVAGDLLVTLGYDRGDAMTPPRRSVGVLAVRDWVTRARRRPDPVEVPVNLQQAGVPPLDRPFEPPAASLGSMERLQDLLDRIVAAFGEGDTQGLEAVLTDSALLRRVAPDLDQGGRHDAARRGFLDAMAETARHRTLGAVNDVVPGLPLSVVVLRAETADGSIEWDTLVIGVRDDRVDRIIWYRPRPRSDGTAPST